MKLRTFFLARATIFSIIMIGLLAYFIIDLFAKG